MRLELAAGQRSDVALQFEVTDDVNVELGVEGGKTGIQSATTGFVKRAPS